MELIVGGAAQGKRAFALSRTGLLEQAVLDGDTCPIDRIPNALVLDRLHLLVRRLMQNGADPQAFILRMVKENPKILLIADEIGCGVVPLDPFERAWREQTGRICCLLAQRAQRVERVCMGIAVCLKEAAPC